MARRKKGKALNGWVLIDKPAGITSSAVVNKIRWVLNAQKAGHAGTLDPDATGLLAVALGEATKTVPYLADALKAYDFTVTFGSQTSTDDASGEVIAQSDMRPNADQIAQALPSFMGDIMQVPPAVSAVKIDGQRAYKRVRGGEEVSIEPRPLYVDSLELIDMPSAEEALLRMVCGKGGYVRSIARDLGAALGGHAHVKWLRRIWSGPFSLSDTVPFSIFEVDDKTPELEAHIRPIAGALADMPACRIADTELAKLRNGNPVLVLDAPINQGETTWITYQGEPLAIGVYRDGEFHPNRVLNLDISA